MTSIAPIFLMKITAVQRHYAETLGTEIHPLLSRRMEVAGFQFIYASKYGVTLSEQTSTKLAYAL